MKVTGRLIKAVCALVASIVLCAGVCLAWFAQNADVQGNGMQTNVSGLNIKDFKVTAYKLTDKTEQTADGKSVFSYTVGSETSGKMEEYGGLTGETATALLLKFDYAFKESLDKQYAIYAHCENTRGGVAKGDTVDGVLHLECALSSVVSFYGVGETAAGPLPSAVTQQSAMAEEEIPDSYGNIITLKSGISSESGGGSFYCIIDYVENKVYTQYYNALTIEGTTFSTPMDFEGDIRFYMQEISAV